jgi:O-antigen biosynthesis protein
MTPNLQIESTRLRNMHFANCPERIRVVECPLVSLSHERNAGISEARGAILCFLDDDAVATYTWLENIQTAFNEHPNAGVIGGTIRLQVPEQQPSALLPGSEMYWSHFTVDHSDYTPVHNWWESPWRANWCSRRRVLLEIGGFRTRYGRRGHKFGGGKEIVAAALSSTLGYEIAIAPNAAVIHNVDLQHFSWYHLRRSVVNGALTSYFLQRDLYIPMASSIRATLRAIWNAPVYPVVKGVKSCRI